MSIAPYPSFEGHDAEVSAACAAVGGELRTYGASVEGRPLRAVCLGEGPRVVVCAGIHGLEVIGCRVALGFLESLPGSALASRAQVWVLPCLNPDGYARTWQTGGRGRVRDLRPNARGVDLNRNFPLPWGARPSWVPGSGSQREGATTYRGRAPLSEPETRALADLLRALDAHAGANLHSWMGTLIPARVLHREDADAYRVLCRAYQQAQTRTHYPRLAGRFDVFTGEQEDHQHHVLRTWAVCVESFSVPASLSQHAWAPSPFWRFNPRDPTAWVASDTAALHAMLGAALDMPRVPLRPGASADVGWTG